MRRPTALAAPAVLALCLSACAGGAPLLDEELRRGSADRTRSDAGTLQTLDGNARMGRAPLPNRMAEIRAERRSGVTSAATPVRPATVPAAPLPDAPAASPDPAPDPYFESGAPSTRPAPVAGPVAAEDDRRVGAPARVGAAAAPSAPAAEADGAPYALRGEAAPRVPAPPPGQPAYPLDPQPDARAPVAAASVPADAPALRPAPRPDAYVPDAAGLLGTINAYRERFGAPPLAYDPGLSAVALDHVRDLARRGEIASTRRDGAGVMSRIREQGGAAATASSLVAGGYADVPAALATWRGDRSQRERLLSPSATRLGLALHEDRKSPFRYYIEAIVAQ